MLLVLRNCIILRILRPNKNNFFNKLKMKALYSMVKEIILWKTRLRSTRNLRGNNNQGKPRK